MRKPFVLLVLVALIAMVASCVPSPPTPPAPAEVVSSQPPLDPPATTTEQSPQEPAVDKPLEPPAATKEPAKPKAPSADAKASEAKAAEAKAAETRAAELATQAEAERQAEAALPVVPPPAPDLRLEPSSALQVGPVTVRTASLPPGTVVKYSLDGSDPAAGRTFPSSGLSVTQSGRLRVWAAQPGGEASVSEAVFTIGEVWAQPGASGDGSWGSPVATLEEALARASTLGVRRIRLSTGQWTLKTELQGTWELSGGWKAPGEAGAASLLVGTKQSGSTQKDPSYTLKVAPNAKITLSNLEVRSPNSAFGAAVLVDKDATLEVTRSRLVGGNGLYGYALRAVNAASVNVVDSFLYGGDGGSSFALSADKSTVKVLRSTLDAGTGNAVSYGVTSTLSKLALISSVVWGGAANSSYAVGLYSSDGCVFQGSTLLGGRGASAWALYLSESEPEIVGCLIGSAGKGKSYGIFANYGKSQPKVLRSNAFFGSASGAFSGADLGAVSPEPDASGAFLDASGRALAGQKANVKAEPVLGPAPDYRLLPTSPAVLLKGGEALTGDAALDRAGRPRGTSPAYGAWATSP